MKNILLVIIAALLFPACKKDNTSPPEFRIQNSTPFKIESAIVKLGNSTNAYPAIDAGSVSEYKQFSDYDYPNIKLRVNNKDIEFTIQPFEGGKAGGGENLKSTCVIIHNPSADTFGVYFKN